jgi:hypothetical protein
MSAHLSHALHMWRDYGCMIFVCLRRPTQCKNSTLQNSTYSSWTVLFSSNIQSKQRRRHSRCFTWIHVQSCWQLQGEYSLRV